MSVDLIASVVVFLLVFFFLYQSYFLNLDRFKNEQALQQIQNKTVQQADLYVNSPGYPVEWNAQSVEIVGLSFEPGVLDWSKVVTLQQMALADYNSAKSRMDLNGFEFRIDIDSNNNALDTNFGADINAYRNVFASQRIVTIGGDYAEFRLSLFR